MSTEETTPGEARSSEGSGLVPERATTADSWPIVKLTVAATGATMTNDATPAKVRLTDGLGAESEARRTVRLECRLCGGRYHATLPWQGRPQGPQCHCSPNTWGNWKRVGDVERCRCGYPMPCSRTVPVTMCRGKASA
jgi:hypothetical protein